MAKLFVSYARVNKVAVDELVGHLGILGHQPWVDTSLRGGQDWWKAILGAICDCDAFVTVVSRASLASDACSREFEWALALGKPVLPVAIEALPAAVPARISTRHIVDYAESGHRAALALAGALAALPPAPALPAPLPAPPGVPLSFLTELIDLARRISPLTRDEQVAVVDRLDLALRSVDPVERQGARDVLDVLRSRGDLVDEVATRVTTLVQTPTAALMLEAIPGGEIGSFDATMTEDDDAGETARLHGSDGQPIDVPGGGLRIGRMADNDIVVVNPKVSRHHAVIVATPDGFVVRDLGSANGTFVGDVKILESHLLHDGDQIRVCDQSWTFELCGSSGV